MSTTTTLAERPHEQESGTIRAMLSSEKMKAQFALALPKHLDADRFVRVALTAMTRTPKLAQCDQASFFSALLTLSQLGLEPDGRLAHLIPFENRKRGVTECQLIIDYKGLVELAMRSGNVASIHADKVCEADLFEYDRGQIKKHTIDFRKPRGAAYAYYAIVRFKDGAEKAEVMTKDEVDAIRARSRAKDSGPWVTDFDEMGKKTVFRRLSKWLQLSPEFRDALDEDADRLEDIRFETAKPVFALPTKPSAEAPKDEPQTSEPAPFTPDTPQKTLALQLAERGIPEAKFLAALKNHGVKASTIMELSDADAETALFDLAEIVEAAKQP